MENNQENVTNLSTRIHPDLLKTAKFACVEHATTMRALITEGLRLRLNQLEKKNKKKESPDAVAQTSL